MDIIENGNYYYEDGWYKTAFRLYIPYGRGFNLNMSQIMAIERVEQLEDCNIRFSKKSLNIPHDDLVGYAKNSDKKGNAGENLEESGDRDSYRQAIKTGFRKHWDAYGDSKQEPNSTGEQFVMCYFVMAKTLDKLKAQVELTKEYYKKNEYKDFTQYIELIPLLTKEYKTIKEFLTSDLSITDKDTDTNLQWGYSGIDFFESGVLQDDLGTPIGVDVNSGVSRTGGIARKSRILFDFNSFTTTQALVAMPKKMSLDSYKYKSKERNNVVPIASVVGQIIANQIILNAHIPVGESKTQKPHKVAHIVLNGFNYSDVKDTQLYIKNERLFKVVDMNNVAINPLQPTGELKEQDKLYTSISKKISTLLNVASNFTLEQADINVIEKAVEDSLAKRWGDNEEDKKIINQDSSIFPEIADVAETIISQKEKYIDDKLVNRAESIDSLYITIERIIGARKSLIGRRTRFEVPFAYQLYYDYSNIASDMLKIVQLINSVNTIMSSLEDGDCLIIHGADRIPPRVIADYMGYELKERAKDRGVRVVYLMDSFITGEHHNILEYKDILYSDYDKDFNYHIQGYVPVDRFEELEKLYRKKLNNRVKMDLTYELAPARALLRRAVSLKIAMVDIDGGLL